MKTSVLAEAPGMQGDRAQSMLRLCCWVSFFTLPAVLLVPVYEQFFLLITID